MASVLLGGSASAFATAGAPDPGFGARGVVELTQRTGDMEERQHGRAVVLPDDRVVVPVFRTEYRVRHGNPVGIRRASVRVTWLRADGSAERASPPVELPKNLSEPRLVRTADGTLLLVGIRRGAQFTPVSLYVMRLSADGIPESAPSGTSAAVTVPLASIPHLGAPTPRVEIGAISVSPAGRVFVVLQRMRFSGGEEREFIGHGPMVVAAIDPSHGLATDFATGGMVVAPASDSRTAASAATAVDADGRLLVLVRSTRSAIAGTAQDVHLSRFDAAGALDPSFAGGRIDFDGGTIDTAYSGTPTIAILRDGSILTRIDVTSDTGTWTAHGIQLRRLLPVGEPSSTFGISGTSTIVLQRSKSSRFGSHSSHGSSIGEPGTVLEQPDGKLVVTVGSDRSWYERTAPTDGVLRTTADGALDTSYEQGGFARFDAPWRGYVASTPAGMDSQGRVVASIWAYGQSHRRSGVVRLLAGDQPAPKASVLLRIDDRRCGASRAAACFDPDGAVQVTGRVLAAGRGVPSAFVMLDVARPGYGSDGYTAPELPAVRTNADGRFTLRLPRTHMAPGSWAVTARVLATPGSQRVDRTRETHFVLGPRADIAMLRRVARAQALAAALGYIVDDSVHYDANDEPIRQCMTPKTCFGRSPALLGLVSATASPEPGKAGLVVRRPGNYSTFARVRTTEFNLVFVVTETPHDTIYSCRGDAAARRRWCPGGTWEDGFNDPFVTAGIDGSPWDY